MEAFEFNDVCVPYERIFNRLLEIRKVIRVNMSRPNMHRHSYTINFLTSKVNTIQLKTCLVSY